MAKIKERGYQVDGRRLANKAIKDRKNTMFISPTGTGKSFVMRNVQHDNPRSLILVPSVEIANGLIDKGVPKNAVFTPIKLRNAIRNKSVYKPTALIVDEAHHDAADTYLEIYRAIYDVPRVGFTATPYRMTPRDTEAFMKNWDASHELLTWRDAASQGFISIPDVITVPLVDDDHLKISNGDIAVEEIETATMDVLHDMLTKLQGYGFFDRKRVSVITMPGIATAETIHNRRPKHSRLITSATGRGARDASMELAMRAETCLVQIRILGEGVDMPVRLLADASPTFSPVKFVQHFGRACRPLAKGESKGLYVCFNRNIQHHGYLLRDVLPVHVQAQAAEVFEGYSRRSGLRMLGIETFGKINPIEVKSVNGEIVHLYLVQAKTDLGKIQNALLIHPSEMEPIWFERELPDGKWKFCGKPDNYEGLASFKKSLITPKMLAWWQKSAGHHGIEPEQQLDGRKFQLLPILANAGMRIR